MKAVQGDRCTLGGGQGRRVLLTGPFGTVGSHVLPHLVGKGYDVVCFDIEIEARRRAQERLSSALAFDTVWGDMRQPLAVREVVERVRPQAIIHLAAIVPPFAYLDLDEAEDVNVNGTRYLLKAAQALKNAPRFIFTSSYSVHGPRNPYKNLPLLTVATPANPADNYARHKVAGEEMIRESGLPWTILRLCSVMPTDLTGLRHPAQTKYMFTMPLEQREHACDARDIGMAIANSVAAEVQGLTLTVAGGADWQRTVGQMRGRIFSAMGIGSLPEDAFRQANPEMDESWHYLDWMDTGESESLLQYQHHSLEDYIDQIRAGGLALLAMRLAGPLVRQGLVRSSP